MTGLPHDIPTSIGAPFITLVPELTAAILALLQAGWVRALSSADVHARAQEIPMTERLRDGMRAALNDDPRLSRRRMIIAPGTESRSQPGVLRPDGRTDIPIFVIRLVFRLGDHDPHAIIECKRIAGGDTALCREYVIAGIDRFCTGKYGLNHAIGFMAGYVIAGNAESAAVGINGFLSRNRRAAEQLARSDLLPNPGLWQSRHPRGAPHSPIDLHHALLEIPTPN